MTEPPGLSEEGGGEREEGSGELEEEGGCWRIDWLAGLGRAGGAEPGGSMEGCAPAAGRGGRGRLGGQSRLIEPEWRAAEAG